MAKALDVYLHQNLAGQLVQDRHGQMGFSYAEAWLKHPEVVPLSHSLPLREKPFDRNECRGFFGGILPEAANRTIIAKNLGITAKNDFAMLEQIGGECAGAVTFMPAGERLQQSDYRYRHLTNKELAEILKTLPKRPLMAGDKDIRLSLAGAQDKIAVHVTDGQISVPLGGAPSTHILKPDIERFKGMVFNEALCMKLAEAIGLHAARVEVGQVEGLDYLLVERYDRKKVPTKADPRCLERLHQEDFCQALGIPSENKYQNEGGPSLKQCFALLREVSSAPVIDLQRLLDAVIFNFLVGNNDAHGKNFSVIYPEGAETNLAPLYDVLSTANYPELSPKMAMKLGGEYLLDKVSPMHFERLAEETGLAKPMVRRRVTDLVEAVLSKIADTDSKNPKVKPVADLIQKRCERTMRKFKA